MTFGLLVPPRLHHIGIVQPDFDAAASHMDLLGYREDYRGEVPEFECWWIFCEAPEGQPAIEIAVPTGGTLAQFNRGLGGLHHYAVLTESLHATQHKLARDDILMIRPEPVKGAGNFICNFISPTFTRGVLIECIEILSEDSA